MDMTKARARETRWNGCLFVERRELWRDTWRDRSFNVISCLWRFHFLSWSSIQIVHDLFTIWKWFDPFILLSLHGSISSGCEQLSHFTLPSIKRHKIWMAKAFTVLEGQLIIKFTLNVFIDTKVHAHYRCHKKVSLAIILVTFQIVGWHVRLLPWVEHYQFQLIVRFAMINRTANIMEVNPGNQCVSL